MDFVNGSLNDIALGVSNVSIPIGDTGLVVTAISGSVMNLDEPANIVVSGSITLRYGPGVTIAGHTVAAFIATGSFTVDSSELILDGSGYLGAYQDAGMSSPKGLFGSGTIDVDLNWSTGVYTAKADVSLLGNVFLFDANFALDDKGDVAISAAQATVNVPNGVPYIGGEQLGSLDFIFVFQAQDLSGSFRRLDDHRGYRHGRSSSSILARAGYRTSALSVLKVWPICKVSTPRPARPAGFCPLMPSLARSSRFP